MSLQIAFENQLKDYNSFLYCNILDSQKEDSYTRNKLRSLYEKNHINFRINFNINSLKDKKVTISLNDSINIPEEKVSVLLKGNKLKEAIALFNTRKEVKNHREPSLSSIFSSYHSWEDKTKLAVELILEYLDLKDIIDIEISVKNTFFDFMWIGKYMTKEGYNKIYQIVNILKERNINFDVIYLGDLNKDKNYFLEFLNRSCEIEETKNKSPCFIWNYNNCKYLLRDGLKIVFENRYFVIALSDSNLISVYKKEKNTLCIWSNISQNKKLTKDILHIMKDLELLIEQNKIKLKDINNFRNYLEDNKYLIE